MQAGAQSLNVPVLISAELATPRRGSRQLVRGQGRAKKPGKLVPRPRELRDDFERKSGGEEGSRGSPFQRDTRCTHTVLAEGLLRGELLAGLISLSSIRSHSTPFEQRAHTAGALCVGSRHVYIYIYICTIELWRFNPLSSTL